MGFAGAEREVAVAGFGFRCSQEAIHLTILCYDIVQYDSKWHDKM